MDLPAGEAIREQGAPFSGTGRKRIAIATLGESFSSLWMFGWTEAMLKLPKHYDVIVPPPFYSTVVSLARAAMAHKLLEQPADYVILIDDDNPPQDWQLVQLITDLELNPQIDLVAGWYGLEMGGESTLSFGRSFRVIKATFQRRYPAGEADFFNPEAPELQDIDWTGLGMVAMRWELLKKCGPGAFLPEQEMPEEHWIGLTQGFIFDDMHFCKVAKAHGARLFVDRRVRVPHLKLRDISPLPPAKLEEAAAAPVAGTVDTVPAFGGVQGDMSRLPFCTKPGCLLREDHPGGCYPGTANASPEAQELSPEVK
jgi:hypothetical protein